jgi:tetratricopeptide (TPR) repeat protein
MGTNSLSRRRRILFRAVCIFFPVVVIAFCEVVLRLFGWGGYADFFRELPRPDGSTLVVSDVAGSGNYFYANREKPGTNDEFAFVMPKPSTTTRIFLVGESAIKGFPQPRAFTAGEFLEQMLQECWPDRDVEVINLGTTAVASFPVLDIVRKAVRYEPDLVIFYGGNNEFFGAYGVASVNRGFASASLISLQYRVRSLAIAQVLQRLFGRNADLANRTLMEAMIGEVYVPPDSELRESAAALLKAHVSEMADVCKANDVPLLVCLPVANERGLAPLGDFRVQDAPPAAHKTVATQMKEAAEKLESAPEEARAILAEVLRQMPEHAKAEYLLATCEESLGNTDAALAHYRAALDLDTMPWRPPTRSVEAIKQAAEESDVPVCDVSAHFRSVESPAGVGWDLMDDHVHFSLKGQYELARAMTLALVSIDGALHVDAEQIEQLPAYDALLQRFGHNPYDGYGVAVEMRQIFDVPFMKDSNPQAFERWTNAVSEAEKTMPPAVLAVARKWQDRKTHTGARRPLSGMIGRELIREQQFDEAAQLFRVAQRCVPEYSSWHMEYVYFELVCSPQIRETGTLSEDDAAIARAELERGRVLLAHGESVSGMAERHMGRLHQLLGEFREAIPFLQTARGKLGGMEVVATDQALILSYIKTGQLESARQLAREGREHSGEFRAHYEKMLQAIPVSNADAEQAAK